MGSRSVLGPLVAILLTAAFLLVTAPSLQTGPEDRNSCPNCSVVIILMDALRYDHLGCYGYAKNTSPAIDSLCARSVIFDNAISQGTWTKPAFSSLFTSRYAVDHNVTASKGFSTGGLTALPEDAVTLAKVFSANGYVTKAMFAPNMPAESFFGLAQGFVEYYAAHLGEDARATDYAIRWIDQSGDRPFFIFLQYYSTHMPYMIHLEYARRFGATGNTSINFATAEPYQFMNRTLSDAEVDEIRAYYDGSVSFADEQIGRLLSYLDSSGLRNSTVVVFLADHGESLGELSGSDPASQQDNMADIVRRNFHVANGDPAHMRIFGHLYASNKVIQVPLVLSPPALSKGQRFGGLVEVMDLAPTLLDIVGIAVPPSFGGRDLLDAAASGKGRDYAFSEVLWTDGNKTIVIRSDRFLFAESLKSRQPRLYDLSVDPYGKSDISSLNPEMVSEFRERMNAYLEGTLGENTSVGVT